MFVCNVSKTTDSCIVTVGVVYIYIFIDIEY